MNNQERNIIDLRTWLTIGLFLISLVGIVGSYFTAIHEIKTQLSVSLYQQSEVLRKEFKEEFASKEEARFIQQSLSEIKGELSQINKKLDKQR